MDGERGARHGPGAANRPQGRRPRVIAMAERWSVDRVVAAAPDSAAEVAGRKLATPGPWSDTGAAGAMVWGSCRGSSKTPYRVSVDTQAPAYRCSCPSRKFPCKHALGLLFLWAQGQLGEDGSVAEPPDWAAPKKKAERVAVEEDGSPEKAEERRRAAEQRARQREERITDGMRELLAWLDDQVSRGLVRARPDRTEGDRLAARLVDAQAPGAARRLRELGGPWSGPDWVGSVLDELGLLRLLAIAWLTRDTLDEALLATVRTHVGFTAAAAEMRQRPAVRDEWLVAGLHDVDEDRVSTRRVWLQGRRTGRWALVLIFAVNGAAFDTDLSPGTVIDADLHFHPGAPELRATVGERYAPARPADAWDPPGGDAEGVRRDFAAALASDPWLEQWPVGVRGRLGRIGDAWALTDEQGASIRVTGPAEPLWRALALTGSRPVSVIGEWGHRGLTPLCVVDPDVTGAAVVVL